MKSKSIDMVWGLGFISIFNLLYYFFYIPTSTGDYFGHSITLLSGNILLGNPNHFHRQPHIKKAIM
jgi:hypothetical protein